MWGACQLRKFALRNLQNRIINLKSCQFPQGTANMEGKEKNNCLKSYVIVAFKNFYVNFLATGVDINPPV